MFCVPILSSRKGAAAVVSLMATQQSRFVKGQLYILMLQKADDDRKDLWLFGVLKEEEEEGAFLLREKKEGFVAVEAATDVLTTIRLYIIEAQKNKKHRSNSSRYSHGLNFFRDGTASRAEKADRERNKLKSFFTEFQWEKEKREFK